MAPNTAIAVDIDATDAGEFKCKCKAIKPQLYANTSVKMLSMNNRTAFVC